MTDTLVWITGASSGIGAALAATVPWDNAHVFAISRSGGAPGTEHVPADLSDPASWSALEAHLMAQVGAFKGDRLVFIHCAGTLEPMGFAGEVDSAAYHRNVVLNSAAPQALGHGFLRAVAAFTGESHLILLSSGAATTPYPGWSSYSAGKAATEMWCRAAGEEQQLRAQKGEPSTRIVAVAPGVVATPMQQQIREMSSEDFPAVDKFIGLHERGELVKPDDAARNIWGLLERDLPTGSCVDVRKL